MEPAAFAAELISRLEKLKLELESRHSLEERLQQIREVGPAAASSRPLRMSVQCVHACADPWVHELGVWKGCFLVHFPLGASLSRMKKRRGLNKH